MKANEEARRFLEQLQRYDLSGLLRHSRYEISEHDDEWGFGGKTKSMTIFSPKPFSEALAVLPPHDRKRIAEAVVSGDPETFPGRDTLSDYASVTSDMPQVEGMGALLPELVLNRQVMISVSTGEQAIQDVNDYYIARQARIQEMARTISVEYVNPHDDLWDWYRFWKENFRTYQERRQYVNQLFKKPIATIASRSRPASVPREPTGWERVDRGLGKARSQLEGATNEEDFQAVGLICREVIISLGQAVYDPEVHNSPDGVVPSQTDASRMLEAYIHHAFAGASTLVVKVGFGTDALVTGGEAIVRVPTPL